MESAHAPSQQLAWQDWPRFRAGSAAVVRAKLRWSRCEEPMRRLWRIDEGHSTQNGRFDDEHAGEADFLITTQMEIGCSYRGGL